MADFREWDQLLALAAKYKGRLIGLFVGLFAALLIIRFGVISAVFIMVCMGIGYYLGHRHDNHQDIKEVINDIFPSQQ
jgi:uncharacterized membrane protein